MAHKMNHHRSLGCCVLGPSHALPVFEGCWLPWSGEGCFWILLCCIKVGENRGRRCGHKPSLLLDPQSVPSAQPRGGQSSVAPTMHLGLGWKEWEDGMQGTGSARLPFFVLAYPLCKYCIFLLPLLSWIQLWGCEQWPYFPRLTQKIKSYGEIQAKQEGKARGGRYFSERSLTSIV